MTRASRFVKEALNLIGEADDPITDKEDAVDPNVIDDTAGGDDLDLGAVPEEPVEDEFGLGGSIAPSVRIEKDGPITVSKGDVQLSIGDDGAIDITLDGGGSLAEPEIPAGDMTDKAAEADKESPEEDDYKIDWDKEKEGKAGEEPLPKEGLEVVKSKETIQIIQEAETGKDFEGQVLTSLDKHQSPATTGAEVSKARKVLSMGVDSDTVVAECKDKKYECLSCESYDECQDKNRKKVDDEDEKDFLTQGYL